MQNFAPSGVFVHLHEGGSHLAGIGFGHLAGGHQGQVLVWLGGPKDAELLAFTLGVALGQLGIGTHCKGLATEELGKRRILVAGKHYFYIDILGQQIGIGHLVNNKGLGSGKGDFLPLELGQVGNARIDRHHDLSLQWRGVAPAEDLPPQLLTLWTEKVVAEHEFHFVGQHIAGRVRRGPANLQVELDPALF